MIFWLFLTTHSGGTVDDFNPSEGHGICYIRHRLYIPFVGPVASLDDMGSTMAMGPWVASPASQ